MFDGEYKCVLLTTPLYVTGVKDKVWQHSTVWSRHRPRSRTISEMARQSSAI